MVYRKPNFGDVAASRGNAKVPFDLLSGTFWDSSWADSTDGKNLPKAGRLVTAVKKKASARLDQLRYGLLVLAWGGACGVLTVLLLTIVSQTAKQSHGFNSPAILIAAIQDHSRQASNR